MRIQGIKNITKLLFVINISIQIMHYKHSEKSLEFNEVMK